ncbi:hypothetical protein ACFRAQ_35190 [Nocardia sp. NPDC056611]|uniref:hypothetical protein n=1 Tax=Nocardia sp. NPDC056611 TaxID=3345877 RepID=UPI0036720D25
MTKIQHRPSWGNWATPADRLLACCQYLTSIGLSTLCALIIASCENPGIGLSALGLCLGANEIKRLF